MYGATAYGYSVDPDFFTVGYSEKQWQGVIDEFYKKYSGIAKWHERIIKEAQDNGFLTIPSGRFYNFRPKQTAYGWKWPITTIKNYPVQGFGAELVKLARIEAFRRIKESGLEALFICTIHDSLVVDTPAKNVYNIGMLLQQSIELTPALCEQAFGYKFSLPIWCEIQAGPNKYAMKDI